MYLARVTVYVAQLTVQRDEVMSKERGRDTKREVEQKSTGRRKYLKRKKKLHSQVQEKSVKDCL